MATERPFAYNTGSPIDGTIQVGDLAVGPPTSGFTNSPTFWNGPDEDLGYVIAAPVSGNTQPTPIFGVFASLGFYRTKTLTDNDFIGLSEYVADKNGTPQIFLSATDASIWLTNNGFWNSYVPIIPSPTPTNTETPTPTQTTTPTVTPTNTTTPTRTPTTPSPTPTNTLTPTNTITPTNTQTPSITPTNTITPTKTVTPSVTPTNTVTPTKTVTPTTTQTPTKTSTPTPTNLNAQGFSYPNFSSTAGITAVGNASVISNIYYLTTANAGQVGNIYRTTAIQYNRNFSAQWSTFIGGGTGADGYCIQWTTTNNTNGATGGGVGLITASSTINAITFLTYTANNFTWYKNNVSQGATSVSSGFWRQTLYFWGDYNHSAQTFALYYSTTNSKPGSPNQTFTSFSFDTGSYYMGFGAAVGGSNDNQEILSWNLQFT